MRRLLETAQESGGAEGRLAELVRGAQPFRPNPFTKRMVLQRVTRSALKQAWVAAHPTAAALLGGAGVAAAAAGWLVIRKPSAPAPVAPIVSVLARPTPPAPPPVVAAPEVAPAPPVAEPRRRATRSEQHTITREAKSRAASEGEDPSQVLEAIRALRKRGDAAHAQVLLDHYLTTHPGGVLTEDALALAIEAASARHDPRAGEYARRYLARFPNGRFRALAVRAAGRD